MWNRDYYASFTIRINVILPSISPVREISLYSQHIPKRTDAFINQGIGTDGLSPDLFFGI